MGSRVYGSTWHLGNYNRMIRESQRVKGLRSKLSLKGPKEGLGLGLTASVGPAG